VEDVIVTDGKVSGLKVDGSFMPADVVVIAMGPWSIQAKKWFKTIPTISGDPNPSVVLRPKQPLTAHALFTEFHGREGITSPEVFIYQAPECIHFIRVNSQVNFYNFFRFAKIDRLVFVIKGA